jgi:hypothetical protein
MSKISELSDGGVIQGGDTLIAVRSGGNVKVTYGGSTTANIDGGTIDGTVIGGTTAAAGSFTTGTFSSDVNVTGVVDASNLFRFGVDNSEIANNYLRFKPSGAAFIDHSTVGQPINFRVSNASSLDKTPLVVSATGIDVTGTVTADAVATGASTFTGSLTIEAAAASVTVKDSNDSGTTGYVFSNASGNTSSIRTQSNVQAIEIKPNEQLSALFQSGGDISFYEDTGTTAKFFWDASAESLSVGKNSLSYSATDRSNVEIKGTASALLALQSGNENSYFFKNGTTLNIHNQSSGPITFDTAAIERLRIASNGDISFFEDTGTTAKFSWSSANETISIGTGTSSTATISAYSRTVSASLPSALRIIENTGASSYWDIGSTGGASNNLNFYANANTTPKMTLTGAGNVGINETVPFGKLHISDTQTGRTTAGSVGNLLVLEDDENGMSILSADAGAGYILFGDTASASSGGISYNHSEDKFNFRTNDAWNRMILDSSGNFLVGKILRRTT